MKHEEWQVLVSAYCDGEISPEERALVEAHLAECSECAATLAAYRRLGNTIGRLPRGAPSRELWLRVQEGMPARAGRPLWRRLIPALSAAAAVAVVVMLVIFSGTLLHGPIAPAPPGQEAREVADVQPLAAEPTAARPTAQRKVPEEGILAAPTAAPPAAVAGISPAPCPGQPLNLEIVSLAVRSDARQAVPRLQGILLDSADQPLPGVTLVVTSTAGWQDGTTTGADGTFALDLPGEGDYRVVVALAATDEAQAWAEEDAALRFEANLPDVGICWVPPITGTAPIHLGPHEEAVITLQVR